VLGDILNTVYNTSMTILITSTLFYMSTQLVTPYNSCIKSLRNDPRFHESINEKTYNKFRKFCKKYKKRIA